jgi:hypothetical protein
LRDRFGDAGCREDDGDRAGGVPAAAGAQVKGDDVNQMIVSGGVWFMGTPRDEALHQYELCKRNMCALANNFVDFGFVALIDPVVQDRPMLDLLVALMSPRPVRLVVLAPGIEVCKQRNAMRSAVEQFAFEGYEHLETDMRRDLGDVGWWFDTSRLTPDETAELLVHEVAARAAPLRSGWHTGVEELRDALTAPPPTI